MKQALIFPLFVLCTLLACNNAKSNKSIYIVNEKSIIIKVYNARDTLLTMQSFTKDTIPNGAFVSYYPNGKVKKWVWYTSELKAPCAAVYYNEKGVFDTLHGNPFIRSITSRNNIYVELINPPNVNILFGCKDFYRDSLIKKVVYHPSLTDSTSWVTLDSTDFIFKNDHNYMCNFLIVDTLKNVFKYVSEPFKLVP